MYRGCVSSPVSSHHSVLKMPGLTGSSGRTLSTYRTTYNSSYISPPTSSHKVYRTPVTQRKTYTTQCGIGSTGAGSGAVSYTRSRALPSGPGPLSSDGTSRLPPSFSLKPRASSVVRTGPVKADYSRDYTRSYGNYRSTNKSSSDSIPDIGLSSRKSSSMLDLSGLSLDRDRVDKLDHINNNSTPSKSKYDSYHYGSSSRSSSRARLCETNATGADYSTSDGISSRGTSQRRTSLSTRETVGVDGRISPSLRADQGSPSSKTDPTRPPSQRRDSVSSTSGRRLIDDRTSNDASNSHNNKISTSLNHLRGKLGLRNLGNTCFMNAVLQSLSNTQPLLDYCLNEDYHLELNKSNSSMKGGLFVAYVNLMKSLWSDKSDSYVSPNNFKTQVQRFAPRFMGYQQQDAQEFLRYLLEGLHEDVNRVRRSNKQSVANEEEEDRLSDSEKAKEYWQRYLKRDDSKIVDMFVGQLKSELRFEECSHKSVTFDPFWDLSLPIPKGRTNVTLQDCIGLFMKEEELDAEERPTCFKCKERRACKKAFSIQRFPKILVLHLKRFSQEMYGRKLTTLVEFPVTGLDLTEFSAQTGGPRVLYNLYAVCNHSGGTHSGHYTAHCKHPYSHEWNFFNDTRLTRTNGQNAVSAEAYVLFYELSNQSSRL